MDLTYYNRYLPHRLPAGHTIFVTFRLAGSLPKEVIARLQEEKLIVEQQAEALRVAGHSVVPYNYQKRWFAAYDHCLDKSESGPAFLCQAAEALILRQAIQFYHDRGDYRLEAYCIMPNHVHLLVTLPEASPLLTRTLQGLKRYTGLQFNKLRQTTGQVWQRESYDHWVRNAQEMQNIVAYILNNPVKAGLADDWQQWPHSYWRQD